MTCPSYPNCGCGEIAISRLSIGARVFFEKNKDTYSLEEIEEYDKKKYFETFYKLKDVFPSEDDREHENTIGTSAYLLRNPEALRDAINFLRTHDDRD